MEKKEEKTGLAFIDRVREVAKELQALQQSAPHENPATLIVFATQCTGGTAMSNTVTLFGRDSDVLHIFRTAISGNSKIKKLLTLALLAELYDIDKGSND